MTLKILNIVLFNVGWFASVLAAANGMPWLGPICVMLLVLIQLGIMRFPRNELILYAVAFAMGWSFDSIVVLVGALGFTDPAQLGGPTTVWMVFMWVNFAATLNSSLRFLQGRVMLAALFGFVGGPASYFAGARLGAVILGEPLALSLLAIGIEWALAMVLLLKLVAFLERDRTAPAVAPEIGS